MNILQTPFLISFFDVMKSCWFFYWTCICLQLSLTHWGREKMAANFLTTIANTFSQIKIYKISLKFVYYGPIDNIPALVQITAWRRPGDIHYLSQWWLVYWRIYGSLGLNELTHWSWDEMGDIFQTTFLNAFSWMKMFEFWIEFDRSWFLRVQLTIIQHWFWWCFGAKQATR